MTDDPSRRTSVASSAKSFNQAEIDHYLNQGVPFWKKPLFFWALILALVAIAITLKVFLAVQSPSCHDEKQPALGTTVLPAGGTTLSPAPSELCSPNYQYSNHTGFCYRANPVIVTIDEATAACLADGAHLASIHSKQENDVVSHFYYTALVNYQNTIDISLPIAGLWIGLVYDTQLQNFKWTDGTEFDFTNWVGGKIPCSDATCSHVWMENQRVNYDDGKHWSDVLAGEQKLAYICKKAPLENAL